MTHKWRWFSIISLLALLVVAVPAIQPAAAQGSSQTFPQTGKSVSGKFLDYWNSHGGLAQQGYPISDQMQDVSLTDGKTYTMQYFERAVFEMHPENAGTHSMLSCRSLGVFQYHAEISPRRARPDGQHRCQRAEVLSDRLDASAASSSTTGTSNGGLAQQGYPISNEFQEKSDLDGKTYTVQYFERAVFEAHPENQAPYDVLLSQLGTFQYRARTSLTLHRLDRHHCHPHQASRAHRLPDRALRGHPARAWHPACRRERQVLPGPALLGTERETSRLSRAALAPPTWKTSPSRTPTW